MNRECPLCTQIVQNDADGLDVTILGTKKKFHLTCAQIVASTLQAHRIENTEHLDDDRLYP